MANLAGVPMGVVDRADTVSKDFASQFKEKIEGKKRKGAEVQSRSAGFRVHSRQDPRQCHINRLAPPRCPPKLDPEFDLTTSIALQTRAPALDA